MKLLSAAVLALCLSFALFAEEETKSAFPETVTLKNPGAVQKHSFKVTPGVNYAVSAKAASSVPRSAVIEIRLFANSKQISFYRTLHSTEKESTLESVFNSGNADRAEVSLCLTDDAMPGVTAQFREIRFVPCQNTALAAWNRNAPSNCRREIRDNGKVVILTPNRRGVGYNSTSLVKYPKNARMRLTAKVKSSQPGMASLAVNCGAKNTPSRHFKSQWSKKADEVLCVDFDTANAEWITLVLRSRNIKKTKGPVRFSEISVELLPPEKPVQKQAANTPPKGNQKK